MVLPLLTRLDHVGIACRDLDKTIELYRTTFGLEVVSLEVNEEQGVREAMLAVGDAALAVAGGRPGYVQLLEPLGPDTPIGKFLARRGEGIHHIGYGVTNITEAMAAISGAAGGPGGGVRLIDQRPRHGSMGASIAFLHPADLGGVLTELVQFASSA
jgi:methylmalonyl-CoA/ethylmalonyl-CoA epimerase